MHDPRGAAARLLVVDDNKVNRLLLARSLELQGHSVASAENGRIALEMLRAATGAAASGVACARTLPLETVSNRMKR